MWGTSGYKTRHNAESSKFIIRNGTIRSKREHKAGDAGLGIVIQAAGSLEINRRGLSGGIVEYRQA